MRKKVASGAIAGVATVSSTVVGMMWQHIDQGVGMWILIACAVVFVLAMIAFVWPDGGGDAKGGTTVAPRGPNSPGIGSVGGDAHFHYGSPHEEPKKSGYKWDQRTMDGLERVLSGIGTVNQTHSGSGHNIGQVNVGAQPLQLTENVISELAEELEAHGHKERKIDVEGMAPHSWAMAEQIRQALAARGFDVASEIGRTIQHFGEPAKAPICVYPMPDGSVLVSIDRMATL